VQFTRHESGLNCCNYAITTNFTPQTADTQIYHTAGRFLNTLITD